jgi:type I restriction enzyme M protein
VTDGKRKGLVQMPRSLNAEEREWYFSAIESLGGLAVTADRAKDTLTYHSGITSDESHVKSADPEELAHAVMIGLLHSKRYKYPISALCHEIHFAHGSKGSKSDEVDILVRDEDQLPYALVELKAASEFERDKDSAIRDQLFGTAHLVGSPKLLVYATVEPKGEYPKIRAICIDYTKYKSYEAWKEAGEPHSTIFPEDYRDLEFEPFINNGPNDLALDSTQADFRSVALSFHNEFFGEHADNTIFVNLVKCLLAKIHDERTRKNGEAYEFQIFYKNGKPDSATDVFKRINALYTAAYKRHIDPNASEIDEINPKEFSEASVKAVVQALQGLSITKGAARHGDIIGAFFEEILRSGFKQDRGMYFTHDNIVRFMVEAADLGGLTHKIWEQSNHPENRLPYVIDPACGSGTFLLHVMNTITETVRKSAKQLVSDHDSQQFYKARLSDDQPNYWAEAFIYGFDPKFIMAITAKVNMVLHGDGSAHIFKDDAFRPFSRYDDTRLRPCSDSKRSVTRAQYKPDVCEFFDLAISNPPFGITLASEIRAKLSTTFALPDTTPSEGLFLERSFQLLKPGGRLAIVLPESVLNAKEMVDVRSLLYRFFHIRCIVSMPRNIFIDTPTLTSLLFAQKKTGVEIEAWDQLQENATTEVETRIKNAAATLRKEAIASHNGTEVAANFLQALLPVVNENDWVSKGGKSPVLMRMKQDWSGRSGKEAADYFREIMKTAGFHELRQSFVFSQIVRDINYEFPVFAVEEIGYKLSKRKEKARANQLCLFRGRRTKSLITNLHLAEEEYDVVLSQSSPKTVLDMVRNSVTWS